MMKYRKASLHYITNQSDPTGTLAATKLRAVPICVTLAPGGRIDLPPPSVVMGAAQFLHEELILPQ